MIDEHIIVTFPQFYLFVKVPPSSETYYAVLEDTQRMTKALTWVADVLITYIRNNLGKVLAIASFWQNS